MPFPQRPAYVQRRVYRRMQDRGEPMVLRRVSMINGPEPFKNPPDVSDDLFVFQATHVGLGADYLNIQGTTAIGRLVPGDQIVCAGPPETTWIVTPMPTMVTVETDSDGISQVDGSGSPIFGPATPYRADALAWDNTFPVVPVSFVHGPQLLSITLTLDPVANTLILPAGGFTDAALAATDVITIEGAIGTNAAINDVLLTLTSVTDTTLTMTGLPGGLVAGGLPYVTLTVVGGPDTDILGVQNEDVELVFMADQEVFGNPIRIERMVAMGWVEADTIGISIAGYGIDPPPKVNDLLIMTGANEGKRSIIQVGRNESNGVTFLFPVQAK
jgi:hypothetical protein